MSFKIDWGSIIVDIVKKKDLDNIVKIYLDCLNGLAYTDDSQICSMLCEKFYSAKPRVEIFLEPYSRLKVKYGYKIEDAFEQSQQQCW